MKDVTLNNGHAHAVFCDNGPMYWTCPYCHTNSADLPGMFDSWVVCRTCKRTALFALVSERDGTYFVTWRSFDPKPIVHEAHVDSPPANSQN